MVQYLGLNLGNGKIWPIQDKVAVLESAAPPTTRKELQSFLGLANYYRWFVPNFATLATPLTDLFKSGGKGAKPVHLSPPAMEAFESLKKVICDQTRLHTPLPHYPFTLQTDASSTGSGAVLSQDTHPQGRKAYLLPQ